MAVTWNVVQLDSTKTVGSLSDVITNVHWTASDSETIGSGDSAVVHDASTYGAVSLADPDSNSFIAYKSVTEANAIAWVKSVLGSDEVTAIEDNLAEQITESKTPSKTFGVPW